LEERPSLFLLSLSHSLSLSLSLFVIIFFVDSSFVEVWFKEDMSSPQDLLLLLL